MLSAGAFAASPNTIEIQVILAGENADNGQSTNLRNHHPSGRLSVRKKVCAKLVILYTYGTLPS
jgi:hypothetical protein